MGIINKRSEIVFFYDLRDNNPNGDPLAENRPRIDEETGICYVTDVRLKRTIRDYLRDNKGKTILIDEYEKDDGTIKTAHERAMDFLKSEKDANNQDILLNECIDARLFGCAIPLGKDVKSIQVTGPVQFNYGRSVHEVEDILIQGTAAFASKKGASQRSFRQDYIIHYGLFRFYGMVNENLAKISKATDEDLDLMLEALWYGTASLSSRSKVGHMPRFLMVITYKEPNYFIGQIDKLINVIKLDPNKPDKALRNLNEFVFDTSKLVELLDTNKDKLDKIRLKYHQDINFKDNIDLFETLEDKNLPVEHLFPD